MGLAEEVAWARCKKLFEMARAQLEKNPSRSKRYVLLARKIAMRHRLSLGSKDYCKKCGVVLVPGATLKVRSSSKTKSVLYICLVCGAARKFGYSRERAAQKTTRKKK